MHGLVKAVLSGDCVVVMGNAAQVRFPRVRPEPRVASDRSPIGSSVPPDLHPPHASPLPRAEPEDSRKVFFFGLLVYEGLEDRQSLGMPGSWPYQ